MIGLGHHYTRLDPLRYDKAAAAATIPVLETFLTRREKTGGAELLLHGGLD